MQFYTGASKSKFLLEGNLEILTLQEFPTGRYNIIDLLELKIIGQFTPEPLSEMFSHIPLVYV